MEFLYQVKEDDSVVGPVERERAHAEGIRHRSGVVFLSRPDGKVLLQHRSPVKKTFPDCYDCSCAFHIMFGESYEEAAKREMVEETGVSAPLRYLGTFSHHDPPENQMVAVFRCVSDDPIRIDKEEATGADFYSKEEVDEIVASKKVTPWLRDGWKVRGASSRQ
jgi:isopentenyldiphosphate isomerase